MKMKPLPWKCGHCRERTVQLVTLPYSTDMGYDGRTYTVNIPDLQVGRCERCGNMVLPNTASQRITETFRQQLGLLKPEQIRGKRESLGLTQKELAKLLGIADATDSRWETGIQIQSRAMDRLLRVFFAFDNVRAAFADEANLSRLGLEEGPAPPVSAAGATSSEIPEPRTKCDGPEFGLADPQPKDQVNFVGSDNPKHRISDQAFDGANRRGPRPKRKAEVDECFARRTGMLSFAIPKFDPSSN